MRLILDTDPNLIFVKDAEGRFVLVNRALAERYGTTPEALIGKKPGEDVPAPREALEYRRIEEEVLRTGQPAELDETNTRPDGQIHWFHSIKVPLPLPGGPTHVLGIATDITKRKQAEEAARNIAEELRQLGDNLPDGAIYQGIITRDGKRQTTAISAGIEALLGITQAEALAEPTAIYSLIVPDDIPRVLAAEAEAFAKQSRFDCVFRSYTRGGAIKWLHARSAPRPQADGTVVWDGIVLDVTPQQETEEKFREAKRRLQHVIASSPAVLYTLAIEDNRVRGIAWMSENIRDVLGYPPDETTQPGWWAGNIHPQDRERVFANTDEELFTADRVANEYRFRHRNGQYRWIHSVMRLIRDAAGNAIEAVGSWLDVTDRKKLEDQFRQSQKMEAVGRLAGGIAHDFNNLLTIINGYSDVLLTKLPHGDPSRTQAAEIRDAGERAARLIAQLLAFSRKTIIEPKVLNLTDVVGQSVRLLQRLIGEDVTLTTTLAPNLKRVKVDPSQVEQVLLNLAVNARDAMPRGGKLIIETRNVQVENDTTSDPDLLLGDYVELVVRDTGTGMTEEVRANIFEPFFTTKEAGQGTGLGLATVYGIVKTYGGHIAVNSELGVGTTFKILFPAAVGEVPTAPTSGEIRLAGKGTETVLLVEDEPSVRKVARIGLEIQGYRVLEAGGGTAAVRVSDAFPGPIHLLITDVIMPGLGGREVAELLRSRRPGLKVLFVSGYTEDAIVRHGISEATDAFLQKPYTSSSLTSKVRAILDGA